ncbi:hypothetical protein JXA84_03805 [candidate division WOR-3 bacterium]|nr:hypothetical protein [candidate division WOR-3 bacterium]
MKRIYCIDKNDFPYIGVFVEDESDYLSNFFLMNNPMSRLFGLRGFESTFLSAIDEMRKIIFIKTTDRKKIQLFVDELHENGDYSGYKIDIPEEAFNYLELIENPRGCYEIYTVMKCDTPQIAGCQRPRGNVVINRNSRGEPLEVKMIHEGVTVATSSVFWMDKNAAEISLEFSSKEETEKWAVYVLSSLSQELISQGKIPLYLAPEINPKSWSIAEKIGFRGTNYKIIEIRADSTRRSKREELC